MKVFHAIDFYVQTFMAFIALTLLFIKLATGEFELSSLAVYVSIYMTPWQLLSSIVLTLRKDLYVSWRRIHLASFANYLLLFCVMVLLGSRKPYVLLFGPLVILNIFYYYVTFKTFRSVFASKTVQ